MLLVAFLVLCLASVVLARGHIGALAEIRFRNPGLILGALALQVVIISVIPGAPRWAATTIHLASYLIAGAFVVSNRHIPGLWLIAAGGASNLLVISANGGVMPASTSALETAGLPSPPDGFSNSIAMASPRLGFLGDNFAVPAAWPVHNVFSFGDVLLALGIAVALHRICRSRLIPSGEGQFTALKNHPDFMKLWASQAISNLGDWVYTLAVATSIVGRSGSSHALAVVFIMQVAPAAVVGALGGPLIDRLPRKRLMIIADLTRAASVGSLLLFDTPSLGHLYGVAVALGVFGAFFQPSLQASLPNVVPRERLVAANALVNGTFHGAITLGPLLGGLLVAGIGEAPAFSVNALSFVLSAALLWGVGIPHQPTTDQALRPLKDLAEGFTYIRSSPLVRNVMVVTGLVLFATALRAPLEPLFVFDSLHSGAAGLGLVGGAWGLGMILGSIAAPAVARRWPREKLLGAGILVVGVCGLAAAWSQVLAPVLVLWLASGIGNAVGTISYESLLQEKTPDALRGRVLAASESVLDLSFLGGAALAGWAGAQLGVRTTYAFAGALFVGASLISHRLLGRGAKLAAPGDLPGAPDHPHQVAGDGQELVGSPSRSAEPAGSVE